MAKRKPKDLVRGMGRRIQSLRKQRGLTQIELAEAVDLGAKYLGEVERGGRDIRISTLGRIASRLNVSPDDLLRAEDQDVIIAEIEKHLHGRDDATRAHVLRVLKEILLLLDTAAG